MMWLVADSWSRPCGRAVWRDSPQNAVEHTENVELTEVVQLFRSVPEMTEVVSPTAGRGTTWEYTVAAKRLPMSHTHTIRCRCRTCAWRSGHRGNRIVFPRTFALWAGRHQLHGMEGGRGTSGQCIGTAVVLPSISWNLRTHTRPLQNKMKSETASTSVQRFPTSNGMASPTPSHTR